MVDSQSTLATFGGQKAPSAARGSISSKATSLVKSPGKPSRRMFRTVLRKAKKAGLSSVPSKASLKGI